MAQDSVVPGKINDTPIRRVHARGSQTITGIAFLTKASGGMAHGLSTNENQFVKRAAVEPRISQIRSQCLLLRYKDADGVEHDAYPDFVIAIDDDWEVQEVKPDAEFARRDVRDRLCRTADAAERHGLAYSVALGSQLFRKSDKAAVEAAWRRVTREFHPIMLRAVDDALQAEPLTAGDLIDATRSYRVAIEDVHGMLASGHVRADMTTPPGQRHAPSSPQQRELVRPPDTLQRSTGDPAMTRMVITAATRLLYNGLNLGPVEQRGDEVDWSCARTKQRFTWTHAEIADMIRTNEASFQTVGGAAPPPPLRTDPELVDPADRADAERKLEYVLALHEASLAHRPPIAEFEKQLATTAKKLRDSNPPKPWTAKRWLERAGTDPTWQHLLDRSFRKGNRSLRLDDEQRAIVDRLIDEQYLTMSRPSIEAIVPLVRHAVNTANSGRPADDRIQHIGRAAIASMVACRDPRDIHAARYGEAAARAMFDMVNHQEDPDAPLDRIEVDFTRADLFVVDEQHRLPIGRPLVGFAIDRCTRMPFGLYIGVEAESVLAIMQVLRNGMFPKTYLDEKIASGEWNVRNSWPAWGMPRTLVFDRGMAGIGHDLRKAASELGIRDVQYMAARRGNQKGGIERSSARSIGRCSRSSAGPPSRTSSRGRTTIPAPTP